MIAVRNVMKHTQQFADVNAPALLTAFGVVGTVTSGLLAAKGAFEAARRIDDENEDRIDARDPMTESETDVLMDRTEMVKLVWPLFLPAVGTAAVTCTAIVLAHRVSSKRAAALAAAYALSEGRFEEYRDKVTEKLGIKKEKAARDEIQQEKVYKLVAEPDAFDFANPSMGKVWIMEAYTGRPFLSTVEAVKSAVNEVNAQLEPGSGRCVKLSAFYDLIGLAHVSTSDYFGFTPEERLELDWTVTTSPDGSLAVHVFDYVNHPVLNPEREAYFR